MIKQFFFHKCTKKKENVIIKFEIAHLRTWFLWNYFIDKMNRKTWESYIYLSGVVILIPLSYGSSGPYQLVYSHAFSKGVMHINCNAKSENNG